MFLKDLIETLQEFQDQFEETESNIEVKVAYQPSWPMEVHIEEIACIDEEGITPVIYLGTNETNSYLSEEGTEALGW